MFRNQKPKSNEHKVSVPTAKDEFISANIEETISQETMEVLSKFDFGESHYLEATIAKDKIMAMAASDASFNLQKLYSILSEQNMKHNIDKDDIPNEQELNDELEKYELKSSKFQEEHTENVMKYIENLKLAILKHSKKDTQNMWIQTEEEYVHISEYDKLKETLIIQKDIGIFSSFNFE